MFEVREREECFALMFELKRPRNTTQNSNDAFILPTLERQRAQETHHPNSRDLLKMIFVCLANKKLSSGGVFSWMPEKHSFQETPLPDSSKITRLPESVFGD